MSKAQEIIRQMLENGNYEALASEENLKAALEAQGCTGEEIAETLAGFSGFPLDDDDLDAVAGGLSASRTPRIDICESDTKV